MNTWEYLMLTQSRKSKGMLSGSNWESWTPDVDLARLGREGWELVSVIPMSSKDGTAYAGNTTDLQWVFKRPAVH